MGLEYVPKVSQKALKLTMGWHNGNMQHVWIGDQLHIHSLHNLLHERERERSFELREATKHQSNNSEHATCNIWTKYNKKSLHFEV